MGMTMAEIKQLAQAMREVLDSDEEDTPVREIALGVMVLLMGPLPEPHERRCRIRPHKLAALPKQWPD